MGAGITVIIKTGTEEKEIGIVIDMEEIYILMMVEVLLIVIHLSTKVMMKISMMINHLWTKREKEHKHVHEFIDPEGRDH